MEGSKTTKEALAEVWETLGLKATLNHPPHLTIRPVVEETAPSEEAQPSLGRSSLGMSTWLPQLPVLDTKTQGEAPFDLEIKRELGQGGMGIVLEAHQRSLGREVAIKRIKPDRLNPASVGALLTEARITGGLEHPNIIPVHALGLDQAGLPLLVMKRIQGVSWRALIHDPHHPAWARVSGDRLLWSIETLVKVCHAIEFAHSKSVLHRDLKTENVMLGDFGEVYVLDWGIALSTDEPQAPGDTAQFAKVAMEGAKIVGTPAFMAPEMTRGGPFAPTTDVYLIGAMLHEILTGQPRHAGTSLFEVLYRAHNSEPVAYGPEIPDELAALCNKATAADPALRFPSARALREALTVYLHHRASVALSDTAAERLDELEAGALRDPLSLSRQRFAESRFGFTQAFGQWQGNLAAARGLPRALASMIQIEARHDNLNEATELLRQLDDPPPEVVEAVEALRLRHADEAARLADLQQMAHGLDKRVSSRQRGLVLLVFAAAALLMSIATLVARGAFGVALDYDKGILGATAIVVIIFTLMAAFRRSLTRNRLNRQMAASFVAYGVLFILFRLLGWRLGVPFNALLALELMIVGLFCALVAISVDARIWRAGAVVALGIAAAAISPGHIMEIYGLVLAVAPIWMGIIWYKGGLPEGTPEGEPTGLPPTPEA